MLTAIFHTARHGATRQFQLRISYWTFTFSISRVH